MTEYLGRALLLHVCLRTSHRTVRCDAAMHASSYSMQVSAQANLAVVEWLAEVLVQDSVEFSLDHELHNNPCVQELCKQPLWQELCQRYHQAQEVGFVGIRPGAGFVYFVFLSSVALALCSLTRRSLVRRSWRAPSLRRSGSSSPPSARWLHDCQLVRS